MVPIAKQPLKLAPAGSTTSSFGLAPRSTTHQNPTPVDTTRPNPAFIDTTHQNPALVNITNLAKQVDSSGKRDQYYCHDFQYWRILDTTSVKQNDVSTSDVSTTNKSTKVNFKGGPDLKRQRFSQNCIVQKTWFIYNMRTSTYVSNFDWETSF